MDAVAKGLQVWSMTACRQGEKRTGLCGCAGWGWAGLAKRRRCINLIHSAHLGTVQQGQECSIQVFAPAAGGGLRACSCWVGYLQNVITPLLQSPSGSIKHRSFGSSLPSTAPGCTSHFQHDGSVQHQQPARRVLVTER